MNANLKNGTARGTIFIAALLATATMANAVDYEFKATRGSNTGQITNVELIDTNTGQIVTDAEIKVVYGNSGRHRRYIPLADHLSGKCPFLNGKSPTSGELTLMATVPGRFLAIWGTIDLGS